jgi:hypothetical protein
MVGVLIALALILVALYGIVSLIQRSRQQSRGLDVVMLERNRIASELSRLSTDAEFLNVYREGETGKAANALSERMSTLTGVFRETVDECDKLARRKYHHLDEQVHLARLQESFEKINLEISSLSNSFQAFHKEIEKSREMINPLQQRFGNVKNCLTEILHDKCPVEWIKEWKELDRGLTALSLGETPASVTDPQAFFSGKVELWMDRADALTVWSEWVLGFEERSKTLVSCRDRLLGAGAENAHVCKMISELLDAVSEIVLLTPEQLVERRGQDLANWIKQQLPAVLSLSMQFLSVLSHPESVATIVKRCVYDANSLIETVKSVDFTKKEQIVISAKARSTVQGMEDKVKWLDSLEVTLSQVRALTTISVREAIPYMDILFSTCVNLQQYVQKIEQFYLVQMSGSKILHQRVETILDRLAHAMADMAEAGLMNSQEYEKLSKWQEDIHQFAETSEPDVLMMERYEKRIANELVIVDGFVRGHKSLDSSLQNHLEKLSHSGRYSGGINPFGSLGRIQSSSSGDLLGAAFGALVIGEILTDESWDNNFDIW